MTPASALCELLARIGASHGATVHLSETEWQAWPPAAVAAMRQAGLVLRASPATSTVCRGCEEACAMPVEVVAAGRLATSDKPPRAFIVCDKRDDTGRIPVPLADLERWRTSGQLLGNVLAALMGIERAAQPTGEGRQWALGVLQGKEHRSPVTLHAHATEGPRLLLAGHTVVVNEVLKINKSGALVLAVAELRRCIDQPKGQEAKDSESPEDRRQRLIARLAELKAAGVKNFLARVAAEEDCHKTRIQQIVSRKPKLDEKNSDVFAGALAIASQPHKSPLSKSSRRR